MILKRDFFYPPAAQNRPLHIWLPEDYAHSTERYPVMYFFDGHNLFSDEDATYGKSWGLKAFLERWGKQMIVVGIECGHEGTQRLREYLPYKANDDYFGAINGIGDQTFQWIIGELKPCIDREFRTCPFRECTGIAGSSMGGLMAIYGAVHHNRFFSKAACISSAIGFCMEPLMADMEASPMDPDTRIYLSWGTQEAWGIQNPSIEDRHSDTYRWNKAVADRAAGYGAAVKMRCQVGGGHSEAYWEQLVPEFMDFLWCS